jgi:hypothetical protein
VVLNVVAFRLIVGVGRRVEIGVVSGKHGTFRVVEGVRVGCVFGIESVKVLLVDGMEPVKRP